MSVEVFDIKKGCHYSKGLHFGFTFSKTIKFRACFTESCLYDHGSNDNYDINKLFGFSTTWFHHKQSARVGWRCLDGNTIQILTYSYNDSQRAIQEADILGTVSPNQWFQCEITDLEDSYEYKFAYELGDEKRIITGRDKKQKDWFIFHYLLFPYFGGNMKAPHDMKIYLERL